MAGKKKNIAPGDRSNSVQNKPIQKATKKYSKHDGPIASPVYFMIAQLCKNKNYSVTQKQI